MTIREICRNPRGAAFLNFKTVTRRGFFEASGRPLGLFFEKITFLDLVWTESQPSISYLSDRIETMYLKNTRKHSGKILQQDLKYKFMKKLAGGKLYFTSTALLVFLGIWQSRSQRYRR